MYNLSLFCWDNINLFERRKLKLFGSSYLFSSVGHFSRIADLHAPNVLRENYITAG